VPGGSLGSTQHARWLALRSAACSTACSAACPVLTRPAVSRKLASWCPSCPARQPLQRLTLWLFARWVTQRWLTARLAAARSPALSLRGGSPVVLPSARPLGHLAAARLIAASSSACHVTRLTGLAQQLLISVVLRCTSPCTRAGGALLLPISGACSRGRISWLARPRCSTAFAGILCWTWGCSPGSPVLGWTVATPRWWVFLVLSSLAPPTLSRWDGPRCSTAFAGVLCWTRGCSPGSPVLARTVAAPQWWVFLVLSLLWSHC